MLFMNSKNSLTSKPHVLILKFTDKLDLRRGDNRIALSNLSIYYTWKNIKSSYNNNEFKISVPTWNDKFESPDGSPHLVIMINLNHLNLNHRMLFMWPLTSPGSIKMKYPYVDLGFFPHQLRAFKMLVHMSTNLVWLIAHVLLHLKRAVL